MAYGEPGKIEGQVKADDLGANGVAGIVKHLVYKFGSRQHTNALTVRTGSFLCHRLAQKRLFGGRQNLGLIKGPTFPDLALVVKLVSAEPQALVWRRAGFAVEHENPIAR